MAFTIEALKYVFIPGYSVNTEQGVINLTRPSSHTKLGREISSARNECLLSLTVLVISIAGYRFNNGGTLPKVAVGAGFAYSLITARKLFKSINLFRSHCIENGQPKNNKTREKG